MSQDQTDSQRTTTTSFDDATELYTKYQPAELTKSWSEYGQQIEDFSRGTMRICRYGIGKGEPLFITNPKMRTTIKAFPDWRQFYVTEGKPLCKLSKANIWCLWGVLDRMDKIDRSPTKRNLLLEEIKDCAGCSHFADVESFVRRMFRIYLHVSHTNKLFLLPDVKYKHIKNLFVAQIFLSCYDTQNLYVIGCIQNVQPDYLVIN